MSCMIYLAIAKFALTLSSSSFQTFRAADFRKIRYLSAEALECKIIGADYMEKPLSGLSFRYSEINVVCYVL